jgi:hypothetical protein
MTTLTNSTTATARTLLKINNHSNLLFAGCFRNNSKLFSSAGGTVAIGGARNISNKQQQQQSTQPITRAASSLLTSSSSLLFGNRIGQPLANAVIINSVRTLYTFNLNANKLIKYRRATRPKKTSDESIELTYEQTQFAEKIGITKSWNSWNTCNECLLTDK